MTIEKKLKFKPYDFKYEKDDIVILKSNEEIQEINNMLFDASPEFDYSGTKWYMSSDKEESMHNLSLKIDSQVSWHMGWPFYGVTKVDQEHFYVAEFYLQNG